MNKLREATFVNGLAGTGKTQEICEQAKKTDMVLTLTHQNKLNIIERAIFLKNNNLKISSIERFKTEPYFVDTLFVDEATMINLFDAASMFSYANKVKLYGDSYQIGDVDMLSISGNRKTNNITNYIKKENITYMYYNHRFKGDIL